MPSEPDAQWAQYEALPAGERMKDRFSGFWRLSEVFDLSTLDLSVLHVAPGERGPMHAHEEPIEEIYMVLEGQLSVELEDETVVGEPGMIFYFPPTVSHRPRNDDTAPGRLLSIRSTVDGDSNFSLSHDPE